MASFDYSVKLFSSSLYFGTTRLSSILVCCPNGTVGTNCRDCIGGREHWCRGNGKCDVSGQQLYLTLSTKLYYLIFHPLEVVARYCDPQLQVDEKLLDFV